jgi:hypothetical protein
MTTKAVNSLPQAFSESKLCVPEEIDLDANWIAWRWQEYFGSASGTVTGREVDAVGLLDRFFRIKNPADALDCAQAYGPLGICAHGHPICHAALPAGGLVFGLKPEEQSIHSTASMSVENFYCAPFRFPDGRFGERVEWWLKLAEAMRACLEVSTSLQKARRPNPKDLGVIYRTLIHELNPLPITEQILPDAQLAGVAARYATDGALLQEVSGARADGFRSRAWTFVFELINKWLIACPVRLYFTYTDSRPVDFSMSFIAGDQRGCFPALVFELVGRIRAVKGKWMVNCAHCPHLVSPRREPRPGQRVFCDECRAEGWPMRYALRDYYARKRKKILARRKRERRGRRDKHGT